MKRKQFACLSCPCDQQDGHKNNKLVKYKVMKKSDDKFVLNVGGKNVLNYFPI